MELKDIKQIYDSQNFCEVWREKTHIRYQKKSRLGGCLTIMSEMNIFDELENIKRFNSIDKFVDYISGKVNTHPECKNVVEIANQVKGFIFELFTVEFLNFFCKQNVIVKDKNKTSTVTFKYCCALSDYTDFGIDLVSRITDRSGTSENAVIQVKYRTDKTNGILSSDIIDKLGFQGAKLNIIEPLREDSKNKPLVLFTNVHWDHYRATFEKHPGYDNLLIIDGNTIDESINNDDFWTSFKNTLNNIKNYK